MQREAQQRRRTQGRVPACQLLWRCAARICQTMACCNDDNPMGLYVSKIRGDSKEHAKGVRWAQPCLTHSLHAATSMLHWIFTGTSRDTVFSCTQWDHRNPGTGTQAPNATRKGSPGPTRHRMIIPPTQYLRWEIVTFPAPLQHQGLPTLALDWNGTKINPDSAGPRESRPHLLLWS